MSTQKWKIINSKKVFEEIGKTWAKFGISDPKLVKRAYFHNKNVFCDSNKKAY